jgi:hypothetical protein
LPAPQLIFDTALAKFVALPEVLVLDLGAPRVRYLEENELPDPPSCQSAQ